MGFFTAPGTQAQEDGCNRHAVAAGRFYSADQNVLKQDLLQCFSAAEGIRKENIRALIVPHAGYVFSGETAARAYACIDPAKPPQRIFILASSHHTTHAGASIYTPGNYATPLGPVPADQEVIKKLMSSESLFTYLPEAHRQEHSLEVQLPFLQYIFGDNIPPVVPIVVTTQSLSDCKLLAEALSPWFDEDNLFVISSDFSHYPGWADANRVDGETAESILTNNPEQFLATLSGHARENVPELATSACGWTSILTLLYLSTGNHNLQYDHLAYTNSGDHPKYGDKRQVVGYHAIVLKEGTKDESFSLTAAEEEDLLAYARNTIAMAFSNKKATAPDHKIFDTPCGAFVTLKKDGRLRGCIGRFGGREALHQVVREMALAAAFNDNRFTPLKEEELEDIDIEISILTPLQKILSPEEFIPGKHGIYIKNGYQSGTFLPQVATETGWGREEMLRHCSHDKAGLEYDGWKEAELFTYEAIIIEE